MGVAHAAESSEVYSANIAHLAYFSGRTMRRIDRTTRAKRDKSWSRFLGGFDLRRFNREAEPVETHHHLPPAARSCRSSLRVIGQSLPMLGRSVIGRLGLVVLHRDCLFGAIERALGGRMDMVMMLHVTV